MLKRLSVTLIVTLFVFSASSAFAAFADQELIRVVYERAPNGMEYGTDLGNVRENTTFPVYFDTGTWYAKPFAVTLPVVNNPANLYVAYFALDRTTNELWATGSTSTPSVIIGGASGLTALKSGTTSMYNLYNTQGGTEYTGLASVPNSYKNKLSYTQGTLANAISTISRFNTEASLASLVDGTNDSITQVLYYWPNATTTIASEKIGIEVATITTTIATTPIPPAFLLMGSGIVGLIGFKKKTTRIWL